ncbi:MAG: hypothetical protein MHM6MM_008949, partial [Cercozoa sp. M6MM]
MNTSRRKTVVTEFQVPGSALGIASCCFVDSTNSILCASGRSTHLFDVRSKKVGELTGHSRPVRFVKTDGSYLAYTVSDDSVRVWDLRKSQSLVQSYTFSDVLEPFSAVTLHVGAAGGTYNRLLLGSNRIDALQCCMTKTGLASVERIAQCPGTHSLTVYEADQRRRHVGNEAFQASSSALTSCIFNPTFEQVVTTSLAGTVSVWNIDTGALQFSYNCTEHKNDNATSACFDWSKRRLITGTHHGRSSVSNFNNGDRLCSLQGKTLRSPAHAREITALGFSDNPSMRRVYSAAWGGIIKSWEIDNVDENCPHALALKATNDLHQNDVSKIIAMMHVGEDAESQFAMASCDVGGLISIWDGSKLCALRCLETGSSVSDLEFHSSSNTLLSVHLDGTLRAHDAYTLR